MRNKLTIIFVCCLFVASNAQGQELNFISPNVEAGIRQHLNIDKVSPISFAQLDTITWLDLSRRGITDIRDLVLLSKLRSLDLSGNMVEDLQPLAVLDSLEWVDLSNNNLKGINDLFYSSAKKLTINVAFNYISDFSLFGSLSSCDFVLEGANFQMIENAPYFDVGQFVCDASGEDAKVYGLVRTNMDETVRLLCGDEVINVSTEDELFMQTLHYDGNIPARVIITNGERGDTTWVVPSRTLNMTDGGTLTIETGLPDKYVISSVFAERGTASYDGTKVNYSATADIVSDVLYVSYSDGVRFRGFTKYNVIGGDANGDVNNDGLKNIVDVTLLVRKVIGIQGDLHVENADVDGDGDIDYDDVTTLVKTILLKKQ